MYHLNLTPSALLEFILDDLRTNMDLAIAWLFTEYSISEGYVSSAQNNFQYDVCFTGLLLGAKEKLGPKDRCVRIVAVLQNVENLFNFLKRFTYQKPLSNSSLSAFDPI